MHVCVVLHCIMLYMKYKNAVHVGVLHLVQHVVVVVLLQSMLQLLLVIT